jgi:hypothetical protein
MLYAVLEEAERAAVKVEQHAHTVALLVAACCIVVVQPVAPPSLPLRALMNQLSVHAPWSNIFVVGLRLGLLMPMKV